MIESNRNAMQYDNAAPAAPAGQRQGRRAVSLKRRGALGALFLAVGRCTLIALAAGCTPAASAKEAVLTDSVFAPDSFWYSAIPKKVELHADSDAFVGEFLRQKKAFYGNVNINTKSYASPVFVVDADVPTVPVKEWDCQKKKFKDKDLAQQWAAVPMPEEAEAGSGNDSEMSIYQPSTDTIWEFWQARKVDGQWQACWGGRLAKASKSDGVFSRHYGTTATSLPFIGGQITAEELRRGEIRHVIGISLVDAEHFNVVSWPAHRSDGYNPKKEPNRIPEGLRFRLDPDVNVDKLKLHPIGKIIAKAAQKYGFVIWDKAGAISIRAQNPKSYMARGEPDPYPTLFKGTPSYAILNGIPWDRLQFLPKDYGKP
jgi:hypothetical protein